MSHLVWNATDRPDLRDPVLVCAFKGWNDAGEAASSAIRFLIDQFAADEFAHVDPEDFFDFTAVRPMIRLEEGATREIDWPDNSFHAAVVRGADRDVILMHGVEPSLHWRAFTDAVMEAASAMGVKLVITLGALLADTPHTRPVSLTGLSSSKSLIDRMGFQRSHYEGPTGIVGVLHGACAKAGMTSASLWAPVPHYVAASPNPKAALALIRGFEGVAGLAVDAAELEEASVDYERQVSAAVATDPDVKAFVERLEAMADELDDEIDDDPGAIPSGDLIAREFQRFLRQRGPGDGPTSPPPDR